MNFIIQLIFLTGLISFPHSQSVLTPSGNPRFYLDFSIFNEVDSIKRAEFYYLVDLTTLNPDSTGKKRVEYSFSLESPGKKPLRQKWRQEISSRSGNYLVDQITLLLAPGKYRLKFGLTDLNADTSSQIDTSFTVTGSATPSVSDIELLWNIKNDTIPNFFKYGMNFVPNPVRTYSPEKDTLLYTYEIYLPDSATLVLNSLVFTLDGKPLLSNRPEVIKAKKKYVGIGAILLDDLQDEGEYRLVLDFVDLKTGKHLKAERVFYFTFGEKEIPPELMDYISFIDYIASPGELLRFKKIKDEKAKILFLKKFWSQRDPEPSTPENEYLEEFILRVQEADKKFSTGKRKGRFTDRGRILIKYGEPDEIKRISMEVPRPDREEWYYYTHNWRFIFIDIRNNGDFKLVYSNNREEPGIPDWQRYIPEEDVTNPQQ